MQVALAAVLLLNELADTKDGSNNIVMQAIVPALEAAARRSEPHLPSLQVARAFCLLLFSALVHTTGRGRAHSRTYSRNKRHASSHGCAPYAC